MNESVRTSFVKYDGTVNTLVIDEDYTNNNNDICISLCIEEWDNGNCIDESKDILLNKEEVAQLIEKLQFYYSRMGTRGIIYANL